MKNHNSIVLVLEVSQGCQLQCQGCLIDKNSKGMPEENTLAKLLSLCEEMDEHDMDFYELELGPTDLMTASNRDEIFDNRSLQEIASYFKITTINSAFIHPHEDDYRKFAKQISDFSPNNWVGLAIPLEMSQVFNDKYVERIRHNVEVFQNHLPNFLKEVVLTVIFDERYMKDLRHRHHTYEELFERTNSLKVHDNTMVDFIFHHGREINNPVKKFQLLGAIEQLNHHYLTDIAKRGDDIEYRHVPAQLLPESHNNELILHNEQLYTRPVLNERLTLFSDHLRFKQEWTYQNFRDELANRFHANLEIAGSYECCSSCEHQIDCAQNYVQDLMRVLETSQCLLIRRELNDIFQVKQQLVLPT